MQKPEFNIKVKRSHGENSGHTGSSASANGARKGETGGTTKTSLRASKYALGTKKESDGGQKTWGDGSRGTPSKGPSESSRKAFSSKADCWSEEFASDLPEAAEAKGTQKDKNTKKDSEKHGASDLKKDKGQKGKGKNSGSKVPEQDEADTDFTEAPSAKAVEAVLGQSDDFVKRSVAVGGDTSRTVTLCFVDGMVASSDISELVIRPLTSKERFGGLESMDKVIEFMQYGGTYGSTVHVRTVLKDVLSDLLAGYCAVLFDQEMKAVTFEVKSPDKRTIGSPKEEKVVKGSADAFVETIRANTMLVRKHIRDPKIRIKEFLLGEYSETKTAMVYIDGYTNPDIVRKTEERIQKIKIDGILTSAAIEDFIVDTPQSPFPQVIVTERPDKFCLNLLEGRVGILADGLPLGFLTPGTFAQMIKATDDDSNHFLVSSILTILRYIALFITIFLPAFYVAIALYHQEMLPLKLMQSIIESKQSVPFPTAVEVIVMLIAFELLQEAGLRLPTAIGQTVSIVGALVVGQSAVEAKVVSPVVVIIVAIAGIAGYTLPNQDMSNAVRLWRFLLVVASIVAGVFGLSVASLLLIHHLCTLECVGVPYMTPFVGMKDRFALRALTRSPLYNTKSREPVLGATPAHGSSYSRRMNKRQGR